MHIIITSPIYNDQCYGSYTSSLLSLQQGLLAAGHDVSFNWSKNISRISEARNVLVNLFFQDETATHILFVDSDMAFDAADVMRMLEYDYDVMAALYSRKVINWERIRNAVKENPDLELENLPLLSGTFGTFNLLRGDNSCEIDEPFPVAAAGTGLMLIRRNVFNQMIDAYPELMTPISPREAPLFRGVERLSRFFNEIELPDGSILGEDFSFCKRWRDIGGQIYGCAWFKILHLGTYEYASDMRSIARFNLPA